MAGDGRSHPIAGPVAAFVDRRRVPRDSDEMARVVDALAGFHVQLEAGPAEAPFTVFRAVR